MRVLIIGYYGFGNIGDEAILSVIIKRLRETYRDNVEICTLSRDTEYTRKLHGVNEHYDKLSLQTVRALIRSQKLIVGGGGKYGKYAITDMCKWALLAKMLNKEVEFYAIGVVPLRWVGSPLIRVRPSNILDLRTRLLAILAMNLSDRISVRDSFSMEVLKRMGIKKTIKIVPDPAIELEPAKYERVQEILRMEGINEDDRPLVGLSLRRLLNNETNEKIKSVIPKVIDWLIEEFNSVVVFIPFCNNRFIPFDNDTEVARELKKMLEHVDRFKIIKGEYAPQEIMGLMGCLDLLIGMRFHSLIFAVARQVPLIGLIYDVKVDYFLRNINESGFYVDELDIHAIKEAIKDRLIDRRKSH